MKPPFLYLNFCSNYRSSKTSKICVLIIIVKKDALLEIFTVKKPVLACFFSLPMIMMKRKLYLEKKESVGMDPC